MHMPNAACSDVDADMDAMELLHLHVAACHAHLMLRPNAARSDAMPLGVAVVSAAAMAAVAAVMLMMLSMCEDANAF